MNNKRFKISTDRTEWSGFTLALSGLLLTLGLALATLKSYAEEQESAVTPCERTANRMHRACRLEVREKLNIELANCANLEFGADRDACRVAAHEAAEEGPDECEAVFEARLQICEDLGEFRYAPDPLADLGNTFVDPDDVGESIAPNPLLSIEAGLINVLRSGEEDEEIVVILNTNETREINGVDCRVVAEAAVEETEEDEKNGRVEYEYVLKELTFDFVTQTMLGDLVYCGENTVEYDDDGFPVSTDGTFISGVDGAKSGFLLRANAAEGHGDRQEFLLDDAEDVVFYEDLGATPPEEFGGEVEGFECEGNCTQTRDLTALGPEVIEWKYYLPHTGFVLALPFELNDNDEFEWTGERERLVCQGRNINILKRNECGIEDGKELIETLCENAGDFFCDD